MTMIDFQGLIALDKPLVEQLRRYLQEKETQLSHSILNAVQPLSQDDLLYLSAQKEGYIKLSDAVDSLGKTIHHINRWDQLSDKANDWESATSQINQALWDYVEVLENFATELFLQLKQTGFEKWKSELIHSVDAIKDILIQRMDNLIRQIKSIEELLHDYKNICLKLSGKKGFFNQFFRFGQSLLDKSLISYLRNSISYLKTRYNGFQRRFNEFLTIKTKVEDSLNKFHYYEAYQNLEPDVQHGILHLYELLKVWEINNKAKSLPANEPIRAIKSSYTSNRAMQFFTDYYNKLRNLLFNQSRSFKQSQTGYYEDEANRKVLSEQFQSLRAEIHTLGATVAKYREFILRTNPNPYIRSRLGFSEWIVGPEPEDAKGMLRFMYKVEYLDYLYKGMLEALKKGPLAYNNALLTKQYRDAQYILHELGQPLTSKNMMKIKSDKMLQVVQQMDELGSFNPHVIHDVEKIFTKALRVDWQYNVLFDSSLFYQLFEIHQELSGGIDKLYREKLREVKHILGKFQNWLKEKSALNRFKEIETDIHDIKGNLQDFLAFYQRASDGIQDTESAGELADEMSKWMLTYRYLFGQFFHQLHHFEPESKLIRNQFLFVDQYFDAVENKIQEIRTNWEVKD